MFYCKAWSNDDGNQMQMLRKHFVINVESSAIIKTQSLGGYEDVLRPFGWEGGVSNAENAPKSCPKRMGGV